MGAKASTGSRAHSDPAREPNTPFRQPVSHPLRLGPKAAKRTVALVIMAVPRPPSPSCANRIRRHTPTDSNICESLIGFF